MKRLKNIFLAVLFAVFVASPALAVVSPTTVAAGPDCENRLLGIPPWYRGLTNDDCSIAAPGSEEGGLANFIWTIVLNVIEMGLVIVVYIAVFFILYGGFMFIVGGGTAAQIEKARKTILNAVIGLAISIGAIAITNLIFGVTQ